MFLWYTVWRKVGEGEKSEVCKNRFEKRVADDTTYLSREPSVLGNFSVIKAWSMKTCGLGAFYSSLSVSGHS